MSTITTGEVRQDFALKFQKELNEKINKYSDKREPFYLLHAIKTHRKLTHVEFRGTWFMLEEAGYKMLMNGTGGVGIIGSMCYRIDNTTGEVKRMYILPPDIPTGMYVDYEDGCLDEILKSGKGAPIIYGG